MPWHRFQCGCSVGLHLVVGGVFGLPHSGCFRHKYASTCLQAVDLNINDKLMMQVDTVHGPAISTLAVDQLTDPIAMSR